MNVFNNLKIGAKIIGIVAVILALAVVIAAVGLFFLNGMNSRLNGIVDVSAAKIKLAARINRNLVEIGRAEKNLILADTKEEMDTYATPIAEYASELEQRMTELEQLVDAAGAAKLDQFHEAYDEYLSINEQVRQLARADSVEQAEDLSQGDGRVAFDSAAAAMAEIVNQNEADLATDKKASDQSFQQALIIEIAVALVALLVGLALGIFVSRGISRNLVTIVEAAEGISDGDIDQKVEVESNDEVGQLATAFQRMIAYLREMAGGAGRIAEGDLTVEITPRSNRDILGNAMVAMKDALSAMAGQTGEATANIGTATNQILAATSEQASTASQQASAVSETTSTVQEARQTAEQSADRARLVAEAAEESRAVADQGLEAVQNTATGMREVQEQVGTIAETILSLSEQTQRIGEIIATVEDIADQSNLLALNAAIEAARAGETGKGFAVVAGEVRGLAEQSVQATDRVRDILSEIQKAANTAVMVTEEGSKRADAGVQQAQSTREAIQAINEQIERVAQAAQQIAASARQQLAGMDQIGGAMDSINQATAQSEAGTRQVEEAAQNLNALASQLTSIVEQYKLQSSVSSEQ
jgi:methyl-accepting chemotaxis protein